ncbi:hypothetical protein JGH11_02970 [Dysgonomonas sp. Marseille-P4677]|uniref:hypothetical protein n=1 Tax=Dysgonomonas sp. Marseille-P4677 TaxID=2364790 RepID=UPI0019126BE1|nr:hypothetical protein [Dysgonomonas sp. Marseille-P4677]MBK5719829.1 hypothetical protein [Dysgonomonas sp. Marseille-P4677]
MKYKYLYILLVGIFFSEPILSQVTIGSGIKPNNGALLDLKQTDKQGANSTKGLMLPRVKLTKMNDLSDLGVTSGDGQQQIGMVVYNVKNDDVCNVYPPGFYVWDGDIWTGLNVSPIRTVKTSRHGISQPNSYMIGGAGVVEISVEKAFDVWNGTSWKDENGSSLLSSKSLESTSLTAEVIWMDARNVVCSISVSHANPLKESIISVHTGNQYGNAVVGLKSNGQLVWSWHIWVTPDIRTYHVNGHFWMDRNLGATSSTSGEIGTRGNLYQWGRKDPFPNNQGWTNEETQLYRLNGSTAFIDKDYSGGLSNPQNNLIKSIESPLSFIKSIGEPYFDWYSTEDSWRNRWGQDGTKSVSDPCPEGWKVPTLNGTASPWEGVVVSNPTSFDINKGWDFSGFGFYPAAASRLDMTGDIAGNGGYYWTASPGSLGLSIAMYLDRSIVLPLTSSYRGGAFSIRCVKE